MDREFRMFKDGDGKPFYLSMGDPIHVCAPNHGTLRNLKKWIRKHFPTKGSSIIRIPDSMLKELEIKRIGPSPLISEKVDDQKRESQDLQIHGKVYSLTCYPLVDNETDGTVCVTLWIRVPLENLHAVIATVLEGFDESMRLSKYPDVMHIESDPSLFSVEIRIKCGQLKSVHTWIGTLL